MTCTAREDMLPPVRSQAEYDNAHPVLKGFMRSPVGAAFSRDERAGAVIPAYMGLIKQCDDQMGVLFDWLEETGRMEDTMIVVTSDHGDILGDHWMGEKTFFHDTSIQGAADHLRSLARGGRDARHRLRRARREHRSCADLRRGGRRRRVTGDHILEGRSLLPLLHGDASRPAARLS